MFESPKQSGDYFLALAAGFAAGVFADLAAPAFALVDLAAPAFAFVDFGAGAAGATFAVVVFAVVAFAAVLFAAIPGSSVENCSTDFKMQDVRRYQSRTTADADCGGAYKTCL